MVADAGYLFSLGIDCAFEDCRLLLDLLQH
jgi:hypothetical protein